MKAKSNIIIHIILLFFVIITLFPLYIMIVTSTKSELGFITNFWGIQWPIEYSNYARAWEGIYKYVFNSIKVTTLTVLGVLVISVLAGYSFSKLKFKFKEILFFGILIFNMIPGSLLLIPNFINLYKLGLNNSHIGLVLSTLGGASIIPIMLSRSYFDTIPDSIFESAYIEGAKELQILRHIVVPLSTPIIGTISLLIFFGTFNSFMWPYIVLSSDELKTIPIGLSKLIGQYGMNFGFQMAAYTLVSVPLMVLISLTMKVYVKGISAGAVKS